MYCTNCGRPLKEGEVCSCMKENNAQENTAQSAQENDKNKTYYEPPQQQFYTEEVYHYAPADPSNYPQGYVPRNRYIAALLALVLGCFGVHNFYLGRKEKATTQLVLCIAGILIVVGPLVACIWSIIDLVNILTKDQTDGNGYNLTNKFS